MAETVDVQGTCDVRFERLRDVFAKSFSKGEVGAAVHVTLNGKALVDLWGGHADAARTRPWQRDTIVNVYSTTKGMTAICAQRLVDEGRLDLDTPARRQPHELARHLPLDAGHHVDALLDRRD